MKWGLVGYVRRFPYSVLRSLGFGRSENGKAMSGPVESIAPKLNSNGASVLIAARAERVCNRNRQLVRKYRTTHEVLSRGYCFDK